MTTEGRSRTVELADRLWTAEVARTPIPPLTETSPDLSVQDAYAIQAHNVDRRVAAGAVVRGRKVGLTSAPMQRLLGVDEPDFGVLLDDMFADEGDEIALETLLQPRVEAEMAFVMARDLVGPGVTVADALTAVAGVLPAIEIVDSRIADWRISLVDTVADNASCGRLVLGGALTEVAGLDLRLTGMLLYRNGVAIDSGAGAAVLGNPVRCVAWLANKLGEFGSGLRRGDVVLPGALHRMTPARPGDVFRAEFAHLGAVTARFGGRAS
jgi:2-keto-4-pentenoate hydratase